MGRRWKISGEVSGRGVGNQWRGEWVGKSESKWEVVPLKFRVSVLKIRVGACLTLKNRVMSDASSNSEFGSANSKFREV